MEQNEFEQALDLLEKAQIPAITLIARVIIIMMKKGLIESEDVHFLTKKD